jgi:hypothetical protein
MNNAFMRQYVAGDPFVAGMALFGAPAHVIVPTRWIAPNSTRRFRGERPC